MERGQVSESQEKISGNDVNDVMEVDAESSNESDVVYNLNPNIEDNEPKETQNPSDRMAYTLEEYVKTKFIPDIEIIHSIFNTLNDPLDDLAELLQDLDEAKISKTMSLRDFILKSDECMRIATVTHLLKKITIRCKKMLDFHLGVFLRNVEFYSKIIHLDEITKVVDCLEVHFNTRRSINAQHAIIKDMFQRIASFRHKVEETKLKRFSKNLEFLSPEAVRDCPTPSDRTIAAILTKLLNLTAKHLLPMLRKVGVLCEDNVTNEASVKSYFCPDNPKDIRKHVVVLVKLLSDSEDLPDCTDGPTYNFYTFLVRVEKWILDSLNLHMHFKSVCPASSNAVRLFKIQTWSISAMEYAETFTAYLEIQKRHDIVKDLLYRNINFQQCCLKVVSKCLLKFCNEKDAEDIFGQILEICLYNQSLTRLYVECIENDTKHLDDIKNKLETMNC
ncbi:uncharacterized protein TNCV_2340841 [Trichonephila clavipes]|nr:uncharacterized protein TNCV_2340841 [Trichonephila clavipes]